MKKKFLQICKKSYYFENVWNETHVIFGCFQSTLCFLIWKTVFCIGSIWKFPTKWWVVTFVQHSSDRSKITFQNEIRIKQPFEHNINAYKALSNMYKHIKPIFKTIEIVFQYICKTFHIWGLMTRFGLKRLKIIYKEFFVWLFSIFHGKDPMQKLARQLTREKAKICPEG